MVGDCAMDDIRLRPATIDDAEFLYVLRHDADVQAASRDTGGFTREDHRAWLNTVLADSHMRVQPMTRLYVIEYDVMFAVPNPSLNQVWQPVGTGRLDVNDKSAEVSISIVSHHRSHGFGEQAISQLVDEAIHRHGCIHVTAEIKTTNAQSMIAFLKAGFLPTEGDMITMARRW